MSSELILIYVLKSTVVTAILYAYYLLALRDNKFHYYNRFYLLGILVLSLIIPLLDLHWFTFEKQVTESTNLELLQLITEPTNQVIESQFLWSEGLLLLIGTIGLAFLGMLLFSIHKIYSIKRNSPIRYLDGIDFIETEVENAPFSFLNNLFWKKTMPLEDDKGQKIFKHEVTHIKQKHSWDRLFCQVLSSILWINPFNWIIQKELQTIHEFIADEEAMGENNTEAFAKLLLETHYGTHFLNPIHPFNYSSIKRRLAMLTKSNKTEYSYLRRVMALPIMLMALAIFSIKVNAVNRIQNLENKIEKVLLKSQVDTIKEKSAGDKIMVFLEKMNSEKGTEAKKIIIIDGKATISDLKPEDIESIRLIKKDGLKLERDAKNSKGEVKELRIEGQIFLEDSDKDQNIMILTTRSKNGEASKQFIMDPSDKIDNRKLFIVDQNSKGEIENAVKRIKGKVATDITVTGFQEILADTVVVHRKPNLNNKIMDDQVVYMLDGKKVDSSIFKNIKPDEIQSINVLKGESAQKKYKDLQGKDVIEIILKKK
jgi:beta-lactamase regulating signal transducer with metallopeptidase domain